MDVSILKKGLVLAKKIAEANNYEGNRFFLGAVLMHRKNVLSVGMNMLKTNPFQLKYGKNRESVFLHAETQSILNALRATNDVSRFLRMKKTMFIVRVKKHPNDHNLQITGNCKPCPGCMRALVDFNIHAVYYSLDQDQIDMNNEIVDFPFNYMYVQEENA